MEALRTNLAAKHPVGPCRIRQDDRHHDGGAHQHEHLRTGACDVNAGNTRKLAQLFSTL